MEVTAASEYARYFKACGIILQNIAQHYRATGKDFLVDHYLAQAYGEKYKKSNKIVRQEKYKPLDLAKLNEDELNQILAQRIYYDFIPSLQEQRKKGEGFDKILEKEIHKNQMQQITSKDKFLNQKSIDERNEKMHETIKNQKTPTLVVAGKSHFFSSEEQAIRKSGSKLHGKKLRNELEKYADENPYAILMSNDNRGLI